jgi:acetyl esterase/lipase
VPSTAPAVTTTQAFTENLINSDEVGGLPIDVYGPATIGDYPVVVTVHGGGWFGGTAVSMAPLADYLAAAGMVVFNSTYRTADGGYPDSFDDVACDIRFALSEASSYTTSTGPITVVAHSAGAHLAAVVSLAGDRFGADCPIDDGVGGDGVRVDRFVGLSGPYDPAIYAVLLANYFGTNFDEDPTPWEAGSPYSYLGENRDLRMLLIHGDDDDLVPMQSSELFHAAVDAAGYDATFEELPGASHMDARSPNLVGNRIVEFIESP